MLHYVLLVFVGSIIARIGWGIGDFIRCKINTFVWNFKKSTNSEHFWIG